MKRVAGCDPRQADREAAQQEAGRQAGRQAGRWDAGKYTAGANALRRHLLGIVPAPG